MTRFLSLTLSTFLLVAVWPASAAGQAFEGVLRERIILASPDALAGLLDVEPTPANVDAVFGLDEERLLAVAAPGGPDLGAQLIERTLYVSARKVRMEVNVPGMAALGGPLVAILDREARTVAMLVPMFRSYMVVDESFLAQQMGALTQLYANSAGFETPSIRSLGDSSIGGESTEGYEIRAGENLIARGWTAPGLRGAVPVETNADDPLATFTDRGLPMRTQVLMRAEGPAATMYGEGYLYLATEVTSIERTEIDESQFAIPSDYTRMEMDGGIPGFPGTQRD